jgi:hypothetical protein
MEKFAPYGLNWKELSVLPASGLWNDRLTTELSSRTVPPRMFTP